MGANASTASGGGPRTPPLEAGTYPARLVQVLDLGLQEQRPYQGKEKPPAQEINVTYELTDEFLLDEDGQEDPSKPRWVSETFVLHNLTSEKARSTARYNAMDPEGLHGGDFYILLGTPVNVTIVQNPGKNGRVYANVAGVSPMRPKDADKAPGLVNEPVAFDLDAPDMGVFLKMPDWLREKITGNLQFGGSPLQEALGELESETAKSEETDEPTGDAENPY